MQTAKEALIEEALKRGEGYNVIAKELKVSAKTIAKVAKRMNELTPKRAIELFMEGKSAVDVVMKTNEDITKITNWYSSWVEAVESEIKYETELKEKYEKIRAIKEEQSIVEEANKYEKNKETARKGKESKKAKPEDFENFLRQGSKRR